MALACALHTAVLDRIGKVCYMGRRRAGKKGTARLAVRRHFAWPGVGRSAKLCSMLSIAPRATSMPYALAASGWTAHQSPHACPHCPISGDVVGFVAAFVAFRWLRRSVNSLCYSRQVCVMSHLVVA